MKPQRLVAIVVLVASAILLFLGTSASHSMSDQVSNVFTGHFTERTTWLFAGGVALGLLGLYVLLVSGRSRSM